MITTIARQNFVTLTRLACYNETHKAEYKKLGRRILKEIAKQMGLQKGEFDIRWNPGGIACSGDHTLHTDKVYVALHDNIGSGWFYWRKCHGRKDYGTVMDCPNQIVYWNPTFMSEGGWNNLIETLKQAQTA
jgi:hypothetical protein